MKASSAVPAPANIPSSEEKHYRKPPLRRATLSPEDMAPRPVLRLGLASPELVAHGGGLLLPAGFGRRSRLAHHPSSGQHSFIGGNLLPDPPTPASGSFAGATGAATCSPVRTGFAGAGGPRRRPPPVSLVWPEEQTRPPPQLRPTFLHRRKNIAGNRYSGERPFRRRTWRRDLFSG